MAALVTAMVAMCLVHHPQYHFGEFDFLLIFYLPIGSVVISHPSNI